MNEIVEYRVEQAYLPFDAPIPPFIHRRIDGGDEDGDIILLARNLSSQTFVHYGSPHGELVDKALAHPGVWSVDGMFRFFR